MPDQQPRARAAIRAEDAPQSDGPGFVSETLAGFRTIVEDRDLLVVTVEVCAQTVVAGAHRRCSWW